MPEVTITTKDLPAGHPALTKSGNWTAQARRILSRKTIPTRYRKGKTPSDNPVRNTLLFNRIADYLESFPEAYDQERWGDKKDATPCGTAFCIAGHAAHETGWNPKIMNRNSWNFDPVFPFDWELLSQPKANIVDVFVHSVGAIELGLTRAEADVLFSANWKPKEGTPSQALRKIGAGAKITDLTNPEDCGGAYDYNLLIEEYANRGKIRVTGIKE